MGAGQRGREVQADVDRGGMTGVGHRAKQDNMHLRLRGIEGLNAKRLVGQKEQQGRVNGMEEDRMEGNIQ